ncbi:MAG: hypothetical protein ACE5K3_02630, partial [bacterium]
SELPDPHFAFRQDELTTPEICFIFLGRYRERVFRQVVSSPYLLSTIYSVQEVIRDVKTH